MSEVFEIRSEEIEELRDDDIRTLIGILCEADYRAAGIRTSGISWGGNQDAADGGLDVLVRDEILPPILNAIPRNITGFQVKKSKMAPANIAKEMKSGGKPRESIHTHIDDKGEYIIVSSGTSLPEKSLVARRKAMREAVSDITGHEELLLDFWDSSRVAIWLRNHPALILWVQSKIGRQITGWQPYGNWSGSPQGIADEYLLDDGLRLYRKEQSALIR